MSAEERPSYKKIEQDTQTRARRNKKDEDILRRRNISLVAGLPAEGDGDDAGLPAEGEGDNTNHQPATIAPELRIMLEIEEDAGNPINTSEEMREVNRIVNRDDIDVLLPPFKEDHNQILGVKWG